jgi:glutathione S-transferase
MLTLHDYLPSGNGYKVRWVLHRLGRPFRLVQHDIMAGATRTPAFLALNPNGRVPVLELPDGTALAESNAILWYLAEGTDMLPESPLDRARVLQWLFFEQYSHEPYIAVARFIAHLHDPDHPRRAELPRLRERGHQALGVMERRLAGHDWLVGARPSLADVGLYAYTHCADEGGFELGAYPGIRSWLGRFAAQPGHIPITWAG